VLRTRPLGLVLLATVALAACGGGGSAGDSAGPPDDSNGTPTPIATGVATPIPSATPTASAGTLDVAFGDAGLVRIAAPEDMRVPRHGLRVLSDGSIEVLVMTRTALLHRGQVALLRITADGQRVDRDDVGTLIDAEEAAFGANGDVWVAGVFAGLPSMTRFARGAGVPSEVTTTLATSPVADVVPLADGGVLVAGSAGRRGGLQLLDADGVVDRSFGTDGLVVDPHGPNDADATFFAADVGADGRVVAVGTHQGAFDFMAFVASYDAVGAPNPAFGAGGTAQIINGGIPNATFAAVAAAPDGGVIVGTSADVARLDPAGVRDTGFGLRSGLSLTLNQAGSALVVESPGDITVVGTTIVLDENLPGCDLSTGVDCHHRAATVLRLHADGTPDRRFADDGTVVADFNARDYAPGAGYTALALAPGAPITVAGNTRRLPEASEIVVARYFDLAD